MQSLLKSALLLIFFSVDLHAYEVKRTIFAFWDKPDVVLYYKLPQEINDDTKVLFIIHGQSRNVEDYINHWVSISEGKNVLLIAPEFKKADYKYFSLLETATSNGVVKQNADMYLHNSIDSFFTYFKSRYNIQAKNIQSSVTLLEDSLFIDTCYIAINRGLRKPSLLILAGILFLLVQGFHTVLLILQLS